MTPTFTLAPAKAQRRAELWLALAVLVFLIAATTPYVWLIEHFGYDDILRDPTPQILLRFHAGGSALILAWLGFALSAFTFVAVALGFKKVLTMHGAHDAGATPIGIASAVAQTIGLLRWVLVVPGLAAAYADPASSTSSRDAIVVVFDAVHHYGGMVIGEMAGQLLLMVWTGMTAWQMFRLRLLPRWISVTGLLTLPFWLLGQTELIHEVVPLVPSIEVIPLAFMAWQAWLAAMAVALLHRVWRDRRALRLQATSPDPQHI